MTEAVEIDGFEIHREIASGGFATVYEATQAGLDRPVAVKVLHAGVLTDEQHNLFLQECRVWGKLSQDAGIVTVHQIAETAGGRPCLIMELCDGTLRDRPGLDLQNVITAGIQAADALQRIHDNQVVHRDIKPHNVFVDRGGRSVSIGDFGISSIVGERTLTGGSALSVDFAPPEAFSSSGSGQSGDIYSLGATLYYMVAGQVPFPVEATGAEKFAAVAMKVLKEPAPHLPATAPDSLDALLQEVLAKPPADRPPSAGQLANRLRVIQQEIGMPRYPIPVLNLAGSPDRAPDRHAVFEAEPSRPRPARPGEGTIVRERQPEPPPLEPVPEPEGPQPDPSADDRSQPHGRRGLLMGVGAVVVLAVLGLLSRALIGGGDAGQEAEQQESASEPASASAAGDDAADFVLLLPPEDVSATPREDGRIEIDWSSEGDDVKYQVSLLGTDQTVIVEAAPFVWELDEPTSSACFEIRTVNVEETRISQLASAPACAS